MKGCFSRLIAVFLLALTISINNANAMPDACALASDAETAMQDGFIVSITLQNGLSSLMANCNNPPETPECITAINIFTNLALQVSDDTQAAGYLYGYSYQACQDFFTCTETPGGPVACTLDEQFNLFGAGIGLVHTQCQNDLATMEAICVQSQDPSCTVAINILNTTVCPMLDLLAYTYQTQLVNQSEEACQEFNNKCGWYHDYAAIAAGPDF